MHTSSQSNIRPQRVEKYPDIWRINWNITEHDDGDGIITYEYDMAEIPAKEYDRGEFISVMISLRYPNDIMTAVINNYLSDMTNDKYIAEFVEMQKWRKDIKSVANDIFSYIYRLEEIREEKLAELSDYDRSTAVNEFFVAGRSMWLVPEERANYIVTIEAAMRAGLTEISFNGISVPVSDAMQMLDALNMYAMAAADVTNAHRAAIKQLITADQIRDYRFDTGYPDKLHFMEN